MKDNPAREEIVNAWRFHLVVILLCGAAIGAVYGQALHFPYVWTDHAEIEGGGLVPKTLDQVGRFWTHVKGQAVTIAREEATSSRPGGAGYFRPIKAASYGLDWQTGGGQPWSFHLSNVLLHFLFCLVLYWVALEVIGREYRLWAAAIALWHALAPQHVETVCWVSARSDSLWGLFGLLAFWGCVRVPRSRHPVTLRVLSIFLAMLAVFSKESGAVAAIFPFLYFWLVPQEGHSGLRKALRAGVWTALGAGLAVAYRLLVVGGVGAGPAPAAAGFWTRLHVFGENVLQSFFPVGLRLADTVEIAAGPTLLGLSGLALFSAWLWLGFRMRRDGRLLFSALAFLLAILPVSQLWPLLQPRGERYLYVPAAFAELAGALLLLELLRRVQASALRRVLAAATLAILVVLGLFSGVRTSAWGNEARLFSEAVEEEPNCAECWNNLAFALAVEGKHAGAERACRAALSVDRRRYWTYLDGFSVRWILSQLLLLRGEGEEAARWLSQIEARVDGGPALFLSLGRAHLLSGEPELSLLAAGRGLARHPGHPGLLALEQAAAERMIAAGHAWLESRPQCRAAR
ncbi:MAG: hypothetical protein GYA21_17060 [Myxococcales bacterium]|nr:hypothetical protein [Myxococcales bacterium]